MSQQLDKNMFGTLYLVLHAPSFFQDNSTESFLLKLDDEGECKERDLRLFLHAQSLQILLGPCFVLTYLTHPLVFQRGLYL